MSIKRQGLKIMVLIMKIMTRYFGFIARPFIQWYADREVIACGMRPHNNEVVTIIYTPFSNRQKHSFYKKQQRKFIETETIKTDNFSGDIVHQVQLKQSNLDDVYMVEAEHIFNKGIRIVSSPKIQIKKDTIHDDKLLKATIHKNGTITFSWRNAKYKKPMIYFFAIDDKKKSYAAIYTRELAWTYPNFNKASLTIKVNPKKVLKEGNQYVARLLLVDYEGWVSHRAIINFNYLQASVL